ELLGEDKVRAYAERPGLAKEEAERYEELQRIYRQVTPEDSRKLTELQRTWTGFTATVETKLTKAGAAIAPVLTATSKVMTRLVPESGMDALALLMNPLGYGANKGVGLYGGEAKKKIVQWGEDLNRFLGTPVQKFKENMDELNKSTWNLV